MMDARELTQRLQALQKAINEKEPGTNVVSILETLKKEVVPTEELLRVGSLFLVLRIPLVCMRPSVIPIAAHRNLVTVTDFFLDH